MRSTYLMLPCPVCLRQVSLEVDAQIRCDCGTMFWVEGKEGKLPVVHIDPREKGEEN